MTLSGKPNVEIASLLSQNLSQHYLDKYFTLTIIANGQLMHLSFKHTNVDFTCPSSTNMQMVINYPESQINHSNLVFLYKRERERERVHYSQLIVLYVHVHFQKVTLVIAH